MWLPEGLCLPLQGSLLGLGFPGETQAAKTMKGKVDPLDLNKVTSKPNPPGEKRLH